MIPTIVISLVTVIAILATNIFFPSFKIKKVNINLYWVIALVGALVILISNLLPWNEFWSGLTSSSSINPLQILILFFSMSFISIYLDEVGFFSYVATWVIKHTKQKQLPIFIVFYILVAVLTMFTSNDIVILTLTPFIIFFCKRSNISPIPYLVSEFICANTWSMMFVIGNPTNIYLAGTYNISFIDYLKVMWLPTLTAGIIEFALLILIFYKKLKKEIKPDNLEEVKIDKIPCGLGLAILFCCIVFLIISSYINLPMYLISAISFGILVISVLLLSLFRKKAPKELGKTLLRGPYELIPFVLSMFVIVLALQKYDVTSSICKAFGNSNVKWIYGYTSLLTCNLINNIPMSILYSSITSGLAPEVLSTGVYASIIGSNIGAFISPLGALAGVMWMNILKKHEVKFSYLDFIKYGLIIGIPVISVALLTLF